MTTQTKPETLHSLIEKAQRDLEARVNASESAHAKRKAMEAAAPDLVELVRAYLETANSPSRLGKIVDDDGISGHAEIADIDAKARALLSRLGAV